MNKGLKQYTKQLTQTVGNAGNVSININKEDANLHISLPLLTTVGLSPIDVGLIYNYQDKGVTGIFGKGFKLNLFGKLEEDNNNNIKIYNADGSVDDYLASNNYLNKETQMTAKRIEDENHPDEYYFEIKDKYDNQSEYSPSYGLEYPRYIRTKNGYTMTLNFLESVKTISNGKGDQIQFTSGSTITKVAYLHNEAEVYHVLLGYNANNQLDTITYKNGDTVTKKASIVYATDSIALIDELLEYQIKYNLTNERVTSFTDGYNDSFTNGHTTTILYENNKTTVTDYKGNKSYAFFDNSGFPLFNMDDKGNIVETQFDKETKQLTSQSSVVQTKDKLPNLFPTNSVERFTANGVTVEKVGCSNPFFSEILGDTVYKITGTGNWPNTLSYELNTNGLATDNIMAIIWGKQLTSFTSSSNVKVILTAGNSDEDLFKKEITDANFDMMTLGVNALWTYSTIRLEFKFTGNASIEIGGIQIIKKEFGSFYEYDDKGNSTGVANSGNSTNLTYNSDNLPSSSIGEDSTMYNFKYDSKGNLQTATTAYGAKIENTYNATYTNNLESTKVTLAGGSKILETRKEYTADGRFLVADYDELGNKTEFKGYDNFGRAGEIYNALGVATKFQHFNDGNLKQILLGNNSMQADYLYDEKKRVKTITLKNGSIYEFNYDNLNNLTEIKLNSVLIFSYTYDLVTGHITKQKYGSESDAYEFTYNEEGLISQVYYTTDFGVKTLRYDYFYNSKNQLRTILDGDAFIINEFEYDENGKVSMVYNPEAELRYQYDNLGNVNNLSKQVDGYTIYQGHDTVSRSKGSNPESLTATIQTNTEYMSGLFDGEQTIKGKGLKLSPVKANGQAMTLEMTKDGIINCGVLTHTNPLRYHVNMPNAYPEASGCLAFWFKMKEFSDDQTIFEIKNTDGQSAIMAYYYEDQIHVTVADIKGSNTPLFTSKYGITNQWNFISINWMNRYDGQGYDDVCEYAFTLNGHTQIFKKKNPRLYVNTGVSTLYTICPDFTTPGLITGLMIGSKSYITLDEMQKYYRITKDYLIDNELVDGNVKAVDFSQTNLFTTDYNMQNLFEIYPLQNSVTSLKGKKPVKFTLRNVCSADKDRTFNFNNKIKRYAYVADGSELAYNFGQSKSGTIMMRAITDVEEDKQYFFESKDASGHTLGLLRGANGCLYVDFNGTLISTNLNFTINEWHTVGLSFSESIIADSQSTLTKKNLRVYLDGQVAESSPSQYFTYGSLITSIGRNTDGVSGGGNLGLFTHYYPLHGQIEMLATRASFCELTTLNTLSNELKGITKLNAFDELGMLKKTIIHEGGTTILSNTISYKTRSDVRYLSKQVSKEIIQTPRFTAYRDYLTDALGNITSISDSTFGNHTYQYDNRGFLTKEDTTNFEYDGNGNITKNGSISYDYDSVIKDRLISVGGQAIAYDENNPLNPKTWNGKNYTFEGRRLVKINDNITYTYNDQGLRTLKTVGDIQTKYYYDGSKLITEIRPNYRLDFLYDENSLLYGFIRNNAEKYFYVRDTMQNILGITSQSGELVVKYNSSAYGEIKGVTGSLANTVGAENPFRYKGYYYDNESGMYYCKSRYFIPQWGRWLNCDSASFLDTESLNEMNLFTYCSNNPILGYDPDGNFFFTALLIGALIGGAVSAATSIASQALTGDKKINWGQVALDATIGAVSGLVSATGIGAVASIGVSGILGFAGSVGGDLIENDGDWSKVNWVKAGVMTAVGGIAGAFGGAGSQNSKEIGKGLMKNKAVSKQFGRLFKATNDYASGTISRRGMTGIFNLYGKEFINTVSRALPSTVAKLTAKNLGRLGIATIVSGVIGSKF